LTLWFFLFGLEFIRIEMQLFFASLVYETRVRTVL
jgi:hypothetical protein